MSYASNAAIDFAAIAREIGQPHSPVLVSSAEQERQLVPTEARSRMQREGSDFLRRPSLNGATVDQEGLTNNYAVEPDMYYSAFPSPEQARRYAVQAAVATLLVVGLLFTSVAVS